MVFSVTYSLHLGYVKMGKASVRNVTNYNGKAMICLLKVNGILKTSLVLGRLN